PRRHRVKYIEQPVGPTAKLIRTYSFEYFLNSLDDLSHHLGGYTEVKDVKSNKTIYHYNCSQRLTQIEYCGRLAKGAHRRDH
ncbi:hypothetical protein, partial [Parachlamydia acanthamoebae]